ncbi:MAG: PorP/SprF family type IX secretion system membrane protein [Crocinitomicaceae bacterium]
MKALVTFACIFIASSTFAQQDMFWNNYSNYNPAMSGFQFQQHGAISYSDHFQRYGRKNIMANYNVRLADKHGLGINFSGTNFALNQTSTALNYNYQFDLGNAGKLSLGASGAISHTSENDSYGLFDYYDVKPVTSFHLHLGAAYKWKHLTVGASLRNITQPEIELDSNLVLRGRRSLTLHAEYDFNIGKQFKLTPRVIYSSFNGPTPLSADLTLTYKNKYSFGVMRNFDGTLGLHVGYDINEKFRIAYSFNPDLNTFDSHNTTIVRHQFTLGFKL